MEMLEHILVIARAMELTCTGKLQTLYFGGFNLILI